MIRDKVLSMLGLAMKAGKVVSGEFAVDEAGKSGEAKLILIAQDASARTYKSITDMCRYYDVPFEVYGTKDSLGHAIGKENRALIAVTDTGFATKIRRDMNEST